MARSQYAKVHPQCSPYSLSTPRITGSYRSFSDKDGECPAHGDQAGNRCAQAAGQQPDRAATALTNQHIWYFVKPGEVSSQPNGEGIHITFDPGRDMYYPLPTRARFPREIERYQNRRISFTRNDNTGDHYAVAGGLLRFTYLDGEAVNFHYRAD